MKYFDFHSHIILKQLFSDEPNIDSFINKSDVAKMPAWCSDAPNIVQTQTHQAQLAEFSNETMVGVALYAMESCLAQDVQELTPMLKKKARFKLSVELLKKISSGEFRPFSDFIVSRTLNNYLNAPQSFNVLKKESFDNPLPSNKVNIFFTVEGCHSLVDAPVRTDAVNRFDPDTIIANLDILLSRINVISVNLTHMQQSNLCDHAFAIQLTKPDNFIPTGDGLTNDGEKVTQALFDRGVCPDLKHMSYMSRKDMRDRIDAGNFSKVQPVVCTHAGFSGIPFTEWVHYHKKVLKKNNAVYLEIAKTVHHDKDPEWETAAFNMSSINLFDEEIIWLVKQKGMIGLSMDRRILGYIDPNDFNPTGSDPEKIYFLDKEYISLEEWKRAGLSGIPHGGKINPDNCITKQYVEDLFAEYNGIRNTYYNYHVLLHLKHFLQVCRNAGIALAEAQRYICIGSDYDGLINPFVNMDKASRLEDLKKYIEKNFIGFLKFYKDSKAWADELDVKEFSERLFYKNGYEFIKGRFK